MALCSGAAGGGCAARLFVGLTLPGSPPPLRGSAAFWGVRGCEVGYLIGGILSPSRKNGVMIGAADGGCAARLFVGLTLPGSPLPLCGSAAFFGGAAGLQGRLSYRGDFYLPPARMALCSGLQAAAVPLGFLSG